MKLSTGDIAKKADFFRIKILETIFNCGKGHVGGAYSCIDILSALYYGDILNISSNNFNDKDRNKFLLSKGHAAIAQYVILQDLGFIEERDLLFMNAGGILGEHPDIIIPGVEFNSGSLGHGLGVAIGWALAARMDNLNYNSYVVLGDGECYEGTIWESAALCSHLKLSNVIAIVDRNGLCIHGKTEEINALEPFDKKWESFGWEVKIVNGHDIGEIIDALGSKRSDKPLVLIANTVKGRGVSFMENKPEWHHGGISREIYNSSMRELLDDS